MSDSKVYKLKLQGTNQRSPFLNLIIKAIKVPSGFVPLLFLALLLFVSIFADFVAPYDPNKQNLPGQFQGPSLAHFFGTDQFGRDVLSRLIFAGRVSLLAPSIALGIALLLGLPTGLIAGYKKGIFDSIFSRISDTILSVPPIIAAIALIAALGPGLNRAMLSIGIVYSPRIYRVVRAASFSASEELFVESARAIGLRPWRIVASHILPNIIPPLIIQATLLLGFALLAESSLSFLGLGVQLPNASWGSMLRQASLQQFRDPYGVVAPGVALTLTILAFNTLGDAFRDAIAGRKAE